MEKVKNVICRLIPDDLDVKTPIAGITWHDIRERFNCPQTETKETCVKLTDKIDVCIIEKTKQKT
jgi:hypothetical protein